MPVKAIICKRRPFIAVLLEVAFTAWTTAAGVDHATDCHKVANFKIFHLFARCCNEAYNFVAGNKGIKSVLPLVARGMNVGMADPAIKNLDLNIVRPKISSINCKRTKWSRCALSGIAFYFIHHTLL